ncbi:MAG: ferrous iron transport protein B [Rickettsiales bacterium]|jgi:ferrous iron transport protein B
MKEIKVAVIGNPNCGKSTLVNAISGSRLQVGNWPGVTVEKKEAELKFKNHSIKLVDLPGIYSLSPYSQEEIIARDFLINQNCDFLINVIDSTNIERNLYLTIQLLELGIPTIVVFNIYDEALSKGINVNLELAEKLLGVKALTAVATKAKGVEKILEAIINIKKSDIPKDISYGKDLDDVLNAFTQKYQKDQCWHRQFPEKWLKLKIIENNLDFKGADNFKNIDLSDDLVQLKEFSDDDVESFVTEKRYEIASKIGKEIVTLEQKNNYNITQNIDKIVLNKFLAIPIFLSVMWLMFKFTFDVSSPFIDWTDTVFSQILSKWAFFGLSAIQTPEWFISLIVDGIIGGVGFIMVFIPVIFAMMFFITFLESSGYMARAAFITDRLMRSMGMHGKSFVPLLIGFGCNVPAIYATRTLESTKDRIVTCMVIPFMSCGARLPVYVLFTSAFFYSNAATVIWLLYVLGIVVAGIVGAILQKAIFKQEAPLFIMELPPYRLPTFKSLIIHTWEKGKHFLIKAGTYILAVSIFVWFLLNLPWGVENKQDSYLGKTGQAIAPIFRPIGFGNWEASASLITGIIAKEIIISTMGSIYTDKVDEHKKEELSFKDDLATIGSSFIFASKSAVHNVLSTFGISSMTFESDEGNNSLRDIIRKSFTPLTAFVFMVFTLLYMPCIVTGIAMKQEFGTWKWFGAAAAIGFFVAWILSFLIFNIAGIWL